MIRFLRERTLGNSPSRLVRQLRENHSEEWLKRVCRYLGACSDFAVQPSLHPVKFQDPPKPVAVPSHRWMLAVYGRDILSRIDQIKASITSTFGSILKMDSTKKVNILNSCHCKIHCKILHICLGFRHSFSFLCDHRSLRSYQALPRGPPCGLHL